MPRARQYRKIIHQGWRIFMKKVLIMPFVVAALFATACGDNTTDVGTTAKVRFFNTVWNAPDGIGFTSNNQFAAGSALGYSQSSQSCSELDAGKTTFGIGIPNASGTALNSATLVTLDDQTISAGGNYTVLAGGNVIHPSVVLLDNRVSGTLGNNQAAVRFVNLAASAEFPFTVLKGTAEVQSNIAFRGATPFSTVASGANAYTIMYNNAPAISATLNLQGGTVNTVVIVRTLAGLFELVTVPSCS
jgi:hypothetical protein